MRKLWLYKLARQLADDEVTHGQFFGENISRTVNTLSKKTGILRPMETIQISEDVTLQFNNTPAPVVIESAGNEVQLSWGELQQIYRASAEHFTKRPATTT